MHTSQRKKKGEDEVGSAYYALLYVQMSALHLMVAALILYKPAVNMLT